MANDNREIVLKLFIDGKEAYTTLKVTDAEIKKMRETAGLLDDEFVKSYSNITKELQKFNTVNTESIELLTKWLTTQNLTEDILDKTIAQLEAESRQLDINSKEWKNNQVASQNLQGAYANLIKQNMNLGSTQNTVLAGSQKMNMAIMQTGYVMNDAQMFLINFRMGMMGVANNIPMIINLLREANSEAKAMGLSIKDVLVKSLTGAGGLMLAVNAIMFVMQFLPSIFNKTTESIEDQKEAVDKLRDAYSKLTKAEMENRITSYKTQLSELEAKYPSAKVPTGRGQYAGTILREQTDEERFGSDLARVNSLKQQVQVLEELNRDLGIQEGIERNIRLNREKLELMNDNPESKNYWKKLVPNATDYNNARALLDKWIEADQKIFKKDKSNKSSKEDNIPTAQELFDKEMEKSLPSSLFEALNPLAQEDPEMLKDVKLMSEMELQKLKIQNIEDEWERKRQFADWELENNKLKYQDYANYEEIKTELEKQHSIAKKEIALEEANTKLSIYANMFGNLRGLFGEHTLAYKAFTVFQTMIDTYQSATAAYKSTAEIPIVGPILAPIAAAAATIFGLGQVANIEKTPVPGYAEGGLLKKGRAGFIEGWHNEVIAPEKTFVEYMNTSLIPQLSVPKINLSGLEKTMNSFVTEVRQWQREMIFTQRGLDLVAVTDKSRNMQKELEY